MKVFRFILRKSVALCVVCFILPIVAVGYICGLTYCSFMTGKALATLLATGALNKYLKGTKDV